VWFSVKFSGLRGFVSLGSKGLPPSPILQQAAHRDHYIDKLFGKLKGMVK